MPRDVGARSPGEAAMLRAIAPYLDGRPLETSSHDAHEARAAELALLGDYRAATRVFLCGCERWPGKRCKRRDCPTCAQRLAAHYKRRMREAMRSMRSGVVVLATCLSLGLHDLAETLATFREALRKLRRRRCFAAVLAGIGCIEPRLSDDGTRWTLHAHMVLDIEGEPDLGDVQRVWRSLTGGRGRFSSHPTPHVFAPAQLARYATKPDKWSPAPASLSLECLATLRRAIRGRRLLIQWPSAPEMSSSWRAGLPKTAFKGVLVVQSCDMLSRNGAGRRQSRASQ